MAYAEEHRKEKQREATQRYRETHREETNAARREYYRENAESEKARRREYHARNPEKEASTQLRWYIARRDDPDFMQHRRDLRNKYAHERRAKVLAHYGGKCVCCGETEPKFLGLDHINNDGQQHRKKRGSEFYKQVIDEGCPKTLQLLCHNCNLAKGFYGVCPHQLKKEEPNEQLSASLRITGEATAALC